MVGAGGRRPRNFAPTGAAACPRGHGRVLDHLHLCSNNGCAHSLQELLASSPAEVEAAGVLLAGSVLAAECLLALTGKVCKRQTSLAAVRAAAGLLCRSSSSIRRHLKRV